MDIKFDIRRILEKLKQELNIEELQLKFSDLRKAWIWDFKKRPEVLFKQFIQNIKVLVELLESIIITAEKISIALEIFDKEKGQKKLEAVIEFLDEILVLPFFLEPLDAPIFRVLIGIIVMKLNSLYGEKNWFKRE